MKKKKINIKIGNQPKLRVRSNSDSKKNDKTNKKKKIDLR